RLRILLADEHEERLDKASPFVRMAGNIAVGTENGFCELQYPRAAIAEHHAGIDNLQFRKHFHAGTGSCREQRRARRQRNALPNTVLPVQTRGRPCWPDKRNPRARCCTLAGLFRYCLFGGTHQFTARRCEGRAAVWNLPFAALLARSFCSSFLPPSFRAWQ